MVNMLGKILNTRGTFEGRALAVFLSVALVLTMTSAPAFASVDVGRSAGGTSATEQPAASPAPRNSVQNETPAAMQGDEAASEPAPAEAKPEGLLGADQKNGDSAEAGQIAGPVAASKPVPEDEKPAAKVAAKVSKPAFEGYAQAQGVIVKVTAAEGVLPEGTAVQALWLNRADVVEAVRASVEGRGKAVKDAAAIDVTLIGPDGNVIQPSDAVNVCFFNANVEGERIGVYRVSDDASKVEAIGLRQAEAAVQSFDVDHFSIYVVTGEGSPALATYNFFDRNGGLLSTQIVKTGDDLAEPAVSAANEGEFFAGWFLKNGSEWGDDFSDFGTQIVSETGVVNVYARYAAARYVHFMSDDAANPVVVSTKRAVEGERVSTLDVFFPAGEDRSIVGWRAEGSNAPVGDAVVVGSSDVVLHPIVENGHWLTFEANGGTYINPTFYAAGKQTVAPAQPTKNGYTFAGWYSDSDFNTPYTFGSALAGSATVYAKWNANVNTKYTLVYWIENADDAHYTFEKAVSVTGKTGEAVSLNDSQTSVYNLHANHREHFAYDNSKTRAALSGAVIAGDGSTVVNLYYGRNTYTLTFKSDGAAVATITAKYNAYIADEFGKDPFSTTYNGRAWRATAHYGYALQTLDRMPGWNVTFNLYRKSSEALKTISYYVQKVDSAAGSASWPADPGNDYRLLKTVDTYFNYITYNEEYHEIQGFTRFSAPLAEFREDKRKAFDNDALALYYLRNSYNLTFQNVDAAAKTEKVKYEAPLADYYGYVPTRPSSVPESYEFKGWYTSPACEAGTEASAALSAMPAGNAIVYAKWAAPAFVVSMYSNVEGSGTPKTMPVSYGATVLEADLPEVEVPSGSTLRGWYTKDDNGNLAPFNFTTQIYRNTSLYPYWTSNTAFAVTYDAGEGAGAVPVDAKAYAQDSRAKVLGGNGLTAPDGKPVFLGWAAPDGSVYHAGDWVKIAAPTTLIAQWGAVQKAASITYNANYPAGVGGAAVKTVDGLANNAEHALLGLEACGFTAPDDFIFLGWSTKQNATAADYAPGKNVRVDVVGANVLYGVWQAKTVLAVEADSGSWDYDGNPHSQDSYKLTIDGGDPVSVGADGTYALGNGDVLAVAVEGSVTNVSEGVVPNVVASVAVTREGKDVSGLYKVERSNGALSVKPLTLVNTGESKTLVYNGSQQEVAGFKTNGLLDGHVLSGLACLAAGTDAGVYEGVFSGAVKIVDATGANVTGNYAVANVPGMLAISPVENQVVVTVVGKSETFAYNATAREAAGYQVAGISNALYAEGDFSFTGKDVAARTDAGMTHMNLAAHQFANTNKNFANVRFEVTDGWVKVDPAPVVITVANAAKIAGAGDPAFVGEVEGLVAEGDLGQVTYTRLGTDEAVGEYEKVLTARYAANPNYAVTVVNGTFAIAPAPVPPEQPDLPTLLVSPQPPAPPAPTPSEPEPNPVVPTPVPAAPTPAAPEEPAPSVPTTPVVPEAPAPKPEAPEVPAIPTSVPGSPAPAAPAPATPAVVPTAPAPTAPTVPATPTAVPAAPVPTAPASTLPPALTTPTPVIPPARTSTPAAVPPAAAPPVAVETAGNPAEEATEKGAASPAEHDASSVPALPANHDHEACWVHFFIILGIVVTAVYGACAALRRGLFSCKLKRCERDLIGGDHGRNMPVETRSHASAGLK